MAEKFLVIGSNSFSGASFVAHVLRAGAEAVGVSRSPQPDEVFLPYAWSAGRERFAFHQLDLNRDLDRIEALARETRPDYVVNFAAQGMVAQSWLHPEHWFATNTLSMVRLHDRLRKLEGLKKFVHASTPEVYGATAGAVTEDAPFNPSTPYAVSKAACDMSLISFHKTYGFPAALTRAANVCGPGQQLYRIIPKTILCILTGQKLRLEGGGRSVRSFIHIRDVAEATLRIARIGVPGRAYHLAAGTSQTIREVVEETCRQMDAKFDRCVELAPPRLAQDSAYLLDCGRARTELDWTPQYALADAVSETIDWVKRNLPLLRTLPAEYIHKE